MAWLGASFLAWAVISPSACLLAFPHDFHVDDGDGGAGGKAAACAAGVSACVAPSDCPKTGNPCVLATCNIGCCGTENAAVDSVAPSGQTDGDCTTTLCDGTGQVRFVDDPGDVPPAQDECHVPTCSQGSPLQAPAKAGTKCSFDDGVKCDEKGNCLQCTTSAECMASEECTSTGRCASAGICGIGSTSGNIDCDACLTDHCCAPLLACALDTGCRDACLNAMTKDPGCADPMSPLGALYIPTKTCLTTSCALCGTLF